MHEQLLDTAIFCNGFFVPANSLSEAVINYAEPFVLINRDFPDAPITRRGTGTRLTRNGRYYLASSYHQSSDYDLETIGILRHDGTVITSHSCIFSGRDADGMPTVDIRIFEFTEPVETCALSQAGWFNLSAEHPQGSSDVVYSIAAGYPHLDLQMDYENRHLRVAPRVIYGKYVGPTLANLEGFDIEPPLDYDPDGLSGAPVFNLTLTGTDFSLLVAGMVTNASRSRFNFIPARKLATWIDQHA